jgi:hypothetical protein
MSTRRPSPVTIAGEIRHFLKDGGSNLVESILPVW